MRPNFRGTDFTSVIRDIVVTDENGSEVASASLCSAICGHCGRRLDHHFFENTNGDRWTAEPGLETIGAMIEEGYPVLWKEMVAKWKEDNGHGPQNKEIADT